jgi:hypothetical protein
MYVFPQPRTPLLLGRRVPATLRIPHALVTGQRPPDVTGLSSTSSACLAVRVCLAAQGSPLVAVALVEVVG